MNSPRIHDATRLDLARTREFGAPGADAGRRRRARLTAYGREILTGIWREAAGPGNGTGVALAAVGSLARGDTGPLSDYDLVLLHDGWEEPQIAALAQRIWYPMWDGGCRLDHSVRTPAQCRQVAAADLIAAVGLLDVVAVAGDTRLVAGARRDLAREWRANARRRLPELLAAVRERHDRHGDVAGSIDPDLKEGRGGLRDMAVVRALAAAWLADRPRGDLDRAHELLLDVRDALHVVTGRGRDRLVREEQDAVAALLRHRDADALMTQVVNAGRVVSFALDATMRRAQQSARARQLRTGPRRPRMTPLGYGCYEHDGEVTLGVRSNARDVVSILRAARLAATRRLPISPTTVARCAAIARPPRWDARLRAAFMDLLASGPGLVPVWQALDHAGIVDLVLPEWGDVRGRPQRGGVHLHTVDRHLVEAVVRADALCDEVARPDLLVLAALLHDIGKVAGARDHSLEGAPVAAKVAGRMCVAPGDVEVVEMLVREHLTLVGLATRRDITDPATVGALLDAVDHRRDVLDLLAALTRADALAAGPKAWTAWRARLVCELTARARRALDGSRSAWPEPGPAAHPQVEGELPQVRISAHTEGARIEIVDADRPGLFADAAGLLGAHRLVVRSARAATYDGVAADVWEVESPTADLPDAPSLQRALRRLAAGDTSPLCGMPVRPSSTAPWLTTRAVVIPGACADATVLEVRASDRPGLLHDIGSVFADSGLSVRSAHIETYAGRSLDTFYLTSRTGAPLTPPEVGRLVGSVIDACDAVAGADSPAR